MFSIFPPRKAVAYLRGQKQRGMALDGELTMSLREHRADIDHRPDIFSPPLMSGLARREPPAGRASLSLWVAMRLNSIVRLASSIGWP
jgi:hypothetical protein